MWVVGAPAGIAGASFTLILSLTIEIIKKLRSITRNKKKKHDKILLLAKSKLNSIEILVSQALIDMEISHEKFDSILKEKKNTRRWKKIWGMYVKNKKIWDWIVLIQGLKKISGNWLKVLPTMYKMVDISAETWNKPGVFVIKVLL